MPSLWFAWTVLVFGTTYLVSESAIGSAVRIPLLALSLRTTVTRGFLFGLLYCKACTGFWAGLAFTVLFPVHVAHVPEAILSGFSGMILGYLASQAFGHAPTKQIKTELALAGFAVAEIDAFLGESREDDAKVSPLVPHDERFLHNDAHVMHLHATYLWQRLDDIEKLAESAAADDEIFRWRVRESCKRRFECAGSDGHQLFWKPIDDPPLMNAGE